MKLKGTVQWKLSWVKSGMNFQGLFYRLAAYVFLNQILSDTILNI